jgi:hypothetical protein
VVVEDCEKDDSVRENVGDGVFEHDSESTYVAVSDGDVDTVYEQESESVVLDIDDV